MFRHLLLPLDGTRLAEAALAPAAFLSRKLGARVTLVHVLEKGSPVAVHGESHLTGREEAARYLAHVAATNFEEGVEVFWHVHDEEVGDVSRSLVDHQEELGPDLVVMASHGEEDLGDRLFGTIPQRVLSRGDLPVLVVRPGMGVHWNCRQVAVALDSDQGHARGLQVGAGLAGSLGSSLHLITVIPTPANLTGECAVSRRLSPRATEEMLEMAEEGAREHLEKLAVPIRGTGMEVSVSVRRGDPAKEISEGVVGADLLVLGSHGSRGVNAFWAGSLTPKLLVRCRQPLLLVPVKAR